MACIPPEHTEDEKGIREGNWYRDERNRWWEWKGWLGSKTRRYVGWEGADA